MRYSTYNAIPHNPKSKKHPYETLEKEEVFKKMQAIGVKLARRIEPDLIIENNEEYGCIKLTTGLILFGKPTRNAGKREFLRLLRAADDILIRPEEEAFEIDLRFDFFDEIKI